MYKGVIVLLCVLAFFILIGKIAQDSYSKAPKPVKSGTFYMFDSDTVRTYILGVDTIHVNKRTGIVFINPGKVSLVTVQGDSNVIEVNQ